MPRTTYAPEEIGRIAEDIYQRQIRSQVFPQHKGEFLILDIDSQDYEIDDNDVAAEKRLRKRRPDGTFFALRIGYSSAYAFGGRMVEET